MMMYLWYKDFIYEEIIRCWLKSEDYIEKSIAIISLPIYSIFGLITILMDIIGVPLYILIGITILILKINGRR